MQKKDSTVRRLMLVALLAAVLISGMSPAGAQTMEIWDNPDTILDIGTVFEGGNGDDGGEGGGDDGGEGGGGDDGDD